MCASSERSSGKAGEEPGVTVAVAPRRGRTLVLGIGNRTAGDDGFGPCVLEALSRTVLPDTVELMEGDILGIDLLSRIEDYEQLILVDAVRDRSTAVGDVAANGTGVNSTAADGSAADGIAANSFGENSIGERGLELETGRSGYWGNRADPVPGEVVVFRLSEVDLDDPDPRFSVHDLSFGGCLKLARLLGLPLPEIRVVGFLLPSVSCLPVSSLEGFELGPAASAAVPEAVSAIRRLLAEAN